MLRHNVIACARDTREGIRKPRQLSAGRTGPFPPVPVGAISRPSSGADPQRPSDNAIGSANTPVIVASGRFNETDSSSRGSSLGGLLLDSGNESGGGRAPICDEPVPNTSNAFDSNPDLSLIRVTDAVNQRTVKGSSIGGSGVSDVPLESLQPNESEPSGGSLGSHSTTSNGRGLDDDGDSNGSSSALPVCVSNSVPVAKRERASIYPRALDETENSGAGESSGRELLCHRDVSNGSVMLSQLPASEVTLPADVEEHGGNKSAVLVGKEEVRSRGKPFPGLFSKPLVESDFPRRSSSGSVGFVNTAGKAATGTNPAPLCSTEGYQTQEEGLPSSGKTLLYHRNHSADEEYYLSASHIQEEKNDDDDDDDGNAEADDVDIDGNDSAAGRDESEGLSHENSSFRLFRTRTPVESKVPRRGSTGHVRFVDAFNGAAVGDHPPMIRPEDHDSPNGGSTASGKQLLYHRSFSGEDGEDGGQSSAGAVQNCAGEPAAAGGDGTGDSYGEGSPGARKPYSGLPGGKCFAGGKRSRQGCSTKSECVDTGANSENGNLVEGQVTQFDESGLSGNSREKRRGGEMLLAPWSSRTPTAIDIPRRRSLVSSGWHPPQSTPGGGDELRSLPVNAEGIYAVPQEQQKVSETSDAQEALVYESGRRLLSENSISSMKPGEEGTGRMSSHHSIGSTPAEWTSGRSGFGLFSNRHPEYAPRRGSMHVAGPVDTSKDGVVVPVLPIQVEASGELDSGSREGLHHTRHRSEGRENMSIVPQHRDARENENDSEGNSAAALTTNSRGAERGAYLSMFRSTMPEIDGELAESEFLQIRSSGRSLFCARQPTADDLPRRRSIDTSDWQTPNAEPTFTTMGGDQVNKESDDHDAVMDSSNPQREEITERGMNMQDSRSMPAKGAAGTSSGESFTGIRWGLGRPMMIDGPRRRALLSASSLESSSRSADTGAGSSSRSVGSNAVLDLLGKRAGVPQIEDIDRSIQREGILPVETTDRDDAVVAPRKGSLLGGVGWKKPKLAVSDIPRRRKSSAGTAVTMAPDDDTRTSESGVDRDEVGH